MSEGDESAAGSILRTKLHRPPVTPDLVCRGRLHELLDAALAGPLVLVSAPAGYGKSALVSHWAESRQEPCAWLSLDDTDGEPVEFLRYFAAAVHTRFPAACRETEALLIAAEEPPAAVLVRTLVNELDAVDDPFILVLDDYHRLGPSSKVHALLRLLLRHPPRPLCLVLITRRDPPLELAALRAGGLLAEVRLGDLRFTGPETAALLAAFDGLAVSDEALANLGQQVEGWAVGLHLAAMASRRAEDPDAFLRELRGGVQNTQEYLVHEVVSRQTPELRDWMLKTSVLDRFCSALCEAVCGSEDPSPAPALDGRAFTRALQEGNLFCISLDAGGEWFRFHHLFQQLLQDELNRRRGSQAILDCHSRAGGWFAGQGLIDEAIRHALKAGSTQRAAELVEEHRMEALNNDQWYLLEKWLSRLPSLRSGANEQRGSTDLRQRPRILLARAWILAYRLDVGALSAILDEIEPLLGQDPAPEPLRGELDYFRGFLAFLQGDGPRALELLKRSLPAIPATHHLLRGEAGVVFCLASQMEGQKLQALKYLDEQLAGQVWLHPARRGRLQAALVLVRILSGDLEGALAANQLFRQTAADHDFSNLAAWGSYLEGLAHFFCGESRAALPHLRRAGERRYELEAPAAADALAGLALACQTLGRGAEAEAALELLFEFARTKTDLSCLATAESCQARLSLANGAPAATFVHSALHRPAEPPGREPMLLFLEAPAVTRGRVLLAEGSAASLEEAETVLEGCLELNREHHNVRQEIEILPLLALARHGQGRAEDALGLLDRALTLAAPGGWIRPFVEPGPRVAELLRRLDPRPAEADFVRRILAAGGESGDAAAPHEPDVRATPPPSPAASRPAAGDLTGREHDVLELLARRLSDKEIAAALGVSPATVKSHLKRLYQKLQVGNRRQAVAEAEALGLVARR